MTRTIAVTGATGFTGRALCAAAAAANVPVIAIGRDAHALADLPRSVDARKVGDLSDLVEAIEALRGADIVFHLADQADRLKVQRSGSTSERLAASVAEAGAELSLDGVVLASSIYATLDEQGRASPYGAAKRAAEAVMLQSGMPSVILRLPPVYGRGEKGSVAALSSLVRRGLPLPFGAARAERAYLFVENLTDLFLAIAAAPAEALRAAHGQRLEPSDGRPISTSELIRQIGRVQQRRARLFAVAPWLLMAAARAAGQADRVKAAFEPLAVDGNAALDRLFGWTPGRAMPDTLAYLAEG